MSENETVTLVKKLNATDLAGEKVMIDFDSGKYFLLKGVANDIWVYIQEPTTIKDIVGKLTEEYEIDEETCQTSVISFLEKLIDHEFIIVSE